MCEGLRNREIAERLSISVRTVEAHTRALLQKTGAGHRTQLIAIGYHGGLMLGR